MYSEGVVAYFTECGDVLEGRVRAGDEGAKTPPEVFVVDEPEHRAALGGGQVAPDDDFYPPRAEEPQLLLRIPDHHLGQLGRQLLPQKLAAVLGTRAGIFHFALLYLGRVKALKIGSEAQESRVYKIH